MYKDIIYTFEQVFFHLIQKILQSQVIWLCYQYIKQNLALHKTSTIVNLL